MSNNEYIATAAAFYQGSYVKAGTILTLADGETPAHWMVANGVVVPDAKAPAVSYPAPESKPAKGKPKA